MQKILLQAQFTAALHEQCNKMPDGSLEKDGMKLSYTEFMSYIQIHEIRSAQRGQGNGSEFILWLADLADEYNVTLSLNAAPENGYAKKELICWYMQAGFYPNVDRICLNELEDFTGELIRRPKARRFTIPEMDIAA